MKLTYTTLILIMVACGADYKYTVTGIPGPKGNSCRIESVVGGAKLSCDDGSSQMISNGADGSIGPMGPSGMNGHSVVFSTAPAPSCSNGGQTILLAEDTNDNSTFDALLDSNIQSFTVCNGQDGATGANGLDAPPTPFSPVALLQPCGDSPNVYDEVFLKLSNGTVLASFSDNINGYNTRFSVLVPGNYATTDGTGCTFSVDASGTITNENFHVN